MQGEIFAAEGYAKTTGDVGVCIATSGPGATNLVTGLADALLDSIPMVAITGQVRAPTKSALRKQGLPAAHGPAYWLHAGWAGVMRAYGLVNAATSYWQL